MWTPNWSSLHFPLRVHLSLLMFTLLQKNVLHPFQDQPMLLTQSSHIHLLQDLNSLFPLTSSFVFPAPLDCSAQPTNMMQSLPATLLPHIQIFLDLYFGLPSKSLKSEAPLLASLLVIYPAVAFLFHSPIKLFLKAASFGTPFYQTPVSLWSAATPSWWSPDLTSLCLHPAHCLDHGSSLCYTSESLCRFYKLPLPVPHVRNSDLIDLGNNSGQLYFL